MKCKECGAELNEGAKFCEECGAAVPQNRLCPDCGTESPSFAKFCFNCGRPFASSASKAIGPETGLSMGDKNVVSGDLIGQKSETHISGGQTIINNTDETKKTNRCHVCGRIVTILEGYDCPKCGGFTCSDCYDTEKGGCTDCIKKESEDKINAYKNALKEVYADGIVSAEERRNLSALQKQLGLTGEEAAKMESAFKKKDEKEKFTTVEKMNLEEAEIQFYQKGNSQEALKLLEPIRERHPESEKVLDLYLEILSETKSEQAETFANSLKIDIENAYLIKLKNALKNNNLNDAELLADKANEFWGDSSRVKSYTVLFKLALFKMYKKNLFLEEAGNLIAEFAEPENTLESTWQFIAKNEHARASGKTAERITKDFCKKNNIYFEFCRSNSLVPAKDEPVKDDTSTKELKQEKVAEEKPQAVCSCCGEKLREGAVFCAKCGTKVGVSKPAAPVKKEKPVQPKTEKKAEEPKEPPRKTHVLSQMNGKTVFKGDATSFSFQNMEFSFDGRTVTVTCDRIQNDSDWDTGSLKLCFWLSPKTYMGGTLIGTQIASFEYEPLKKGYGFPNIKKSYTLPDSTPCEFYWFIVTINEYYNDKSTSIAKWINYGPIFYHTTIPGFGDKINHRNMTIYGGYTNSWSSDNGMCPICRKKIADRVNDKYKQINDKCVHVIGLDPEDLENFHKSFNFCGVDCAKKWIDANGSKYNDYGKPIE